MYKYVKLEIRMTEDDKASIQRAATLSNTDMSKLCLPAIMRHVKRIEKQAARQPEGESE